jgi:hypothetical protein
VGSADDIYVHKHNKNSTSIHDYFMALPGLTIRVLETVELQDLYEMCIVKGVSS